jgi:outer membrane protein assembly factor BamB
MSHATSESGEFFIFRARPDQYEKLATNRLGDLAMATPAICGSQIFHRVTHTGDGETAQEVLYCIGSPVP